MTQPFRSPSWFRIRDLRPRLRDDTEVSRHRYRGKAWYVLRDPVSGQTHRLTLPAYQFVGRMDGSASIDEIFRDLADELGAAAPSESDIVALLTQLHGADLLQTNRTPDTAELHERQRKYRRTRLMGYLKSPFAIRVPLFNPDRMLERTSPLVTPLFGEAGAVLWLAVVIAGAVLATIHFSELSENVADRLLAYGNLPLLACAYVIVKTLHEFGHAYAVKSFGGEVRDMGFMCLVFFPVPFVDASAATSFRSKWRRAAVGAAGILVELFLAALAMIAWLLVEPGTTRAFLYNVMMIGGVSTLLFNGNPLLRFDGYYILSDLLEIPNLAQRATQYWGHLAERYLFAMRGVQDFDARPGERIWLFLFAPASLAYRTAVLFSLALFVGTQFFVIGVILASWAVLSGLVLPIGKQVVALTTAPRWRRRRVRVVLIGYGAIIAAALVVCLAPMPAHVTTEGIVWIPEKAYVKATTDGFIDRWLARPGDPVQAGDALLQVAEPALAAQIETMKARVEEMQANYASVKFGDRGKAQVALLELDKEKATLAREMVRQNRQIVTGAADGVFVVPNASDVLGRFVKEGTVLGYVMPPSGRTLRVVVAQAEIDLVRNNVRGISVLLSGALDKSYVATIAREVPAAGQELPSKALGLGGGGQFLADPRDTKGTKSLQRLFQFDLELAELPERQSFGSHAFVRFDLDWEPIGVQAYRRVRQLFLARFNV